MDEKKHRHLSSAEMASLWNFYMANSMSHSILKHFIVTTEDRSIKELLVASDLMSLKIMQHVGELFDQEAVALPVGFSDADIHLDAPKLFSDTFYLQYVDMMFKLGIIFYSITLPNITRLDVRSFIADISSDAIVLSNKITECMLEKGIYVRPPHIPKMDVAEFVNKQSFFNGFFGDKRPLLGIEIAHLFANIQFNTIKSVLLVGFSQVAKSEQLIKYFIRGKQVNQKQHQIFSDILKMDDLPITMPSQFEVTTSTTAPYSEKLMLFHITNLSSAKIRNLGDSIAVSPRHDLSTTYGRLVIETGNFAEDGGNLLIENGWMERPPHNIDRTHLAKHKF